MPRMHCRSTIDDDKTESRLRSLLQPSYDVYDFFMRRLEEQISQYGRERMQAAVQDLKTHNEELVKRCKIISMVSILVIL